MDTEYKTLSLFNGSELTLHIDGTYTLRHTNIPEKDSDFSTFSIVQCYSNGHVNKVPIENLIALRYDYKYSHGIYPLANILASSIVSAEDSICVKYMKNDIEYSTSIDVQKIRPHSMLGLKGIDIIGNNFDKVTGWYINDDLISDHLECTKPTSPSCQIASENLDSITPDWEQDIQNIEKGYDLEKVFSEYLKSVRNIRTGQQFAKDVLAHCQTKEGFWYVIKTLFKCDTRIYRSPVVEYLNEHDISHFLPNIETLSSVCNLLFSETSKPEKNIEFIYHFKDILTDEIKEKIIESTNYLPHPNLYIKLCDMLDMNTEEIIEYCIRQSNAASYYCIYETLLKIYKKEGYFAISKLTATHINDLDESHTQVKLIKRLILSIYKKEKNTLNVDIAKIKEGGFNEYSRLCSFYESKKKIQTTHDTITSNVGKTIKGRCIAKYSNHYFLMTNNGIRILLPISMSTRNLHKGVSVNVQIAYADKKYDTLHATQKIPIDYKKIMQMPLLNNGDIIEISFDLYGEPVLHKCYKKIKIRMESYPKDIDNKVRYKAKVIRQTTDKYHYLVKIVE